MTPLERFAAILTAVSEAAPDLQCGASLRLTDTRGWCYELSLSAHGVIFEDSIHPQLGAASHGGRRVPADEHPQASALEVLRLAGRS